MCISRELRLITSVGLMREILSSELAVAYTNWENVQARSRGLQEFAHAPDMIANSRCHRRGRSQCLVDATEVIKREPDHDGRTVVLKLLAETVREASES